MGFTPHTVTHIIFFHHLTLTPTNSYKISSDVLRMLKTNSKVHYFCENMFRIKISRNTPTFHILPNSFRKIEGDIL